MAMVALVAPVETGGGAEGAGGSHLSPVPRPRWGGVAAAGAAAR